MMCMRPTTKLALVTLATLAALLAPIVHASAQRAGESSGMIDMKSGRIANVFSAASSRAPDTLATSADKVFAALPAVFASLPVPLTVVDTVARAMGAVRVTVRRPIGGERLSLLLECGSGSYGPNAERYTVQLTLLSLVRVIDASHTALDTRVSGLATQNGLSSSVGCSSTGRLEDKLAALLRQQLGL